ncbi:MAG: glutamate racemase [Bacillota bacterium]
MTKIGLFDSGVGGLTVMNEIKKQIPKVNIEYFGDTKHNPYGNLTSEKIYNYSKQILNFLDNKNVDGVIVACNTASAVILPEITRKFSFPIVGMIESGAKTAVKKSKNKNIGVIGTNYTINSLAYHKSINNLDSKINVIGKACPHLVSLAEKGEISGEKPKKTVEECLLDIEKEEIDTLVLGCTHLPIFWEYIKYYIDSKTELIDPAVEAVKCMKKTLNLSKYNNEKSQSSVYKFYTTGNLKKFEKISSDILNEKIIAKKVVLDN